MFRNYLAAALRNLSRNRLYAGINIIGLAVGFAAAILIALFVRDEFSYDKWLPDYQRIYRVSSVLNAPDRSSRHDTTEPQMAAWLKIDFPQVEAVARLTDG